MDSLKNVSLSSNFRRMSPNRAHNAAVDTFAASQVEISGVYSNRADLNSKPVEQRSFKHQIAASFFLATATAAALAGVPQAAQAQELAAPSKEQLKAQGLALLLNSKAAHGETIPLADGLKKLKPEVREKIKTMPTDVQEVFVNLEPPAMQWMLERVQGTTWAAIIPINNREAIISGTALGQDVYARALKGLRKGVENGKIPAAMEGRLTDLIQKLQSLTPEQRGTLVNALEAQRS